MTFRGRDVFSIRVPRSGAQYSLLFECMEAAHWRGLTDEQFALLIPFEQARIIAHYRAHHRLESVIAQQQQRDAEVRAKKNKAK